MPSATIQPHKATIKRAVSANNNEGVEIVAATMVRVYITSMRNDRWTPQGHEGALVLLRDRSLGGGLFFRLVPLDTSNPRVVWEHEVYFNFEYRINAPFFHSFESDDGCQVGFLFMEEEEAEEFAAIVQQKSELYQIATKKDRRKATTLSNSETSSLKSVPSMEKLGTEDGSNSRKGSLSAGFLGLFRRKEKDPNENDNSEAVSKKEKKKNNSKKKGITADDIGDPTDFRHLAHIGFNSSTGTFDVQNIPPEWKQVFQKAGITTAQLQNKDTAAFIAEFVKKNVTDDTSSISSRSTSATENHTIVSSSSATNHRGPPPPLPAKLGKKAPPPPPSSSSSLKLRSASLANPQTSSQTAVDHPKTPRQSLPKTSLPVATNTREQEEEENGSSAAASSSHPPIDPSRAQLLASIRNANTGILRPVQRSPSAHSIGSIASVNANGGGATNQSDIMASMLAKALAERNRKIAHSDSDDNDSDW